MAHNPQKVRDLAEQIQALDSDDRLELLKAVVTPELELRLLAENLQQQEKAIASGETQGFLRLAGAVSGPEDLSRRKGFSRS